MADVLKHFDDSYSDGVTLRDGTPVLYWARGAPRSTPAEEAEIVEKVRALTGVRVRLGAWRRFYEYNPLDDCCEVDLIVLP